MKIFELKLSALQPPLEDSGASRYLFHFAFTLFEREMEVLPSFENIPSIALLTHPQLGATVADYLHIGGKAQLQLRLVSSAVRMVVDNFLVDRWINDADSLFGAESCERFQVVMQDTIVDKNGKTVVRPYHGFDDALFWRIAWLLEDLWQAGEESSAGLRRVEGIVRRDTTAEQPLMLFATFRPMDWAYSMSEAVHMGPASSLQSVLSSTVTTIEVAIPSNWSTLESGSIVNVKHLRRLRLSNCGNVRHIKDEAIRLLPDLEQIAFEPFSRCTVIGSKFLAYCPKLEAVDLSSFSEVDKLGPHFLRGCESLVVVDVSNFKKLKHVPQQFLSECTNLITLRRAGWGVESVTRPILLFSENIEVARDDEEMRTWLGSQSYCVVGKNTR